MSCVLAAGCASYTSLDERGIGAPRFEPYAAGESEVTADVAAPLVPQRRLDTYVVAVAPAAPPAPGLEGAPPGAPVQADRKGPRRGDWEVTLSGVGNNNQDFDAGSAQVSASVGYFLSDVFQLVLRQNISFIDPGPGVTSAWDGVSRLALDIHPIAGPVSPFIGVHAGYVYGDTVTESLEAGPQGGLKYYVNQNAFLQLAVEWQYFFDEDESLTTAFDDGQFVHSLGIGVKF